MEVLKRKEVIIEEKEAASGIKDGMTIGIGGYVTSSHPMVIIRHIIRNGIRNLTVVGSGTGGLEVDILLGAGCVKKVITPYVGAEALCPIGPFFRAMAQRGEVDVWETEEAHYYAGLRAAGNLLPFQPVRAGGVGTSYPEINPDLKLFQDPIKGETLVAVPAISVDVALFHVAYADPYGNVQHEGSCWNDQALFRASNRAIVQVEKVISNEDLRRNPYKTTIHGADAIIRAPYGSHPFASPGFYLEDRLHINEYTTAATAYLKKGNRGPFEAYLQKYVYGPETHADYLELIGFKRLLSLYEY